MQMLKGKRLRILFLTESREDYLADSLLHGLVSLGHEVTDYPRKHILYRNSNPSSSSFSVRGGGFTLYYNLDDRSVDRSFIIQKLENEAFDLVILGQIWRQWGQLLDLAPFLQALPVVLLDGDDDNRLFHRSGTRLRRFGWQPFPIRSGRCFYFKREWLGNASHGRWCRVLPTSFSIPAEKIRRVDASSKKKLFSSHCVDPEVAEACGLQTSYAFSSEKAYYDDLALSRFAVTTKRGGWDCLRHYEIAAAGALPCVRLLETKHPCSAPHGLKGSLNCVTYRNWSDLKAQIDFLESNPLEYNRIHEASASWVRQHTTIASAQRLLDVVLTQ